MCSRCCPSLCLISEDAQNSTGGNTYDIRAHCFLHGDGEAVDEALLEYFMDWLWRNDRLPRRGGVQYGKNEVALQANESEYRQWLVVFTDICVCVCLHVECSLELL